jgi:beta-ureidopropionase
MEESSGHRTIGIGLVQMRSQADVETALATVEHRAAEAVSQGARIVCLPDLTLHPFFPQFRADARWMQRAEPIPDGPSCRSLADIARKHKVALVASIYEMARDGVYYDTGVAFSPDGELAGRQRMMHIPEEPSFNEKFYYRPGNCNYPVFPLAGVRVGIALGQDLFYPEHHRLLALHGAELVLGPNAIAAESDPLVLASKAAAVMNHLYVGVANRVGDDEDLTFIGHSHLIGPTGVELASADAAETVLVEHIDLDELARVRRTQNYWLRDRRPDTYGDLVRQLD